MSQIHLRKLEEKDVPFMLEWMHDPSIACFFRFDAMSMTEEKCLEYIRTANSDDNSKHFAIADENDEYLGTISLKNIDYEKKEAEYAISTRKIVHGTGAATLATNEILKIAFEELGLNKVYLNVLVENKRANAFYQKEGFLFDYCENQAVETNEGKKDLNWYYINYSYHY